MLTLVQEFRCGNSLVMGDEERPRCPLLVPKRFSGEGNFDDWISHFETVASINGWDDVAKLQWMTVRMTGVLRPPSVDFRKLQGEVIVRLSKHYWNVLSHQQ